MAKRSKSPQFRVTPEEDEHLRQAAKDADMKLSDYLRAVVLHATVVVVDGMSVTLIPSTVTLAEADEALRARFRAILLQLQGQGESPASSEAAACLPQQPPAPGSPPATPAPPEPPRAAPPSSPGTADQGTVGASSSAAAPAPAPGGDAGASPGEHEPEHELAVSSIERCAHCGGTEGRHQSFCETVRGEPPVAPAAAEADSGKAAYVAARVGEGEMQVVAEAEWRQRQAQPDAAPALQPTAVDAAKQPCPSCGTMKLPAVQCPDCGRRPG